MKKHIILFFLMTVLLCACQSNPNSNAVYSKNDGSFDININVSADEARFPDTPQNVRFSNVFYSTDGSVRFQVEIDDTVFYPNMPVIEVKPHYLTQEDAEKVAKVIFGESATFYEAEPKLHEVYSKEEIVDQINRWVAYTSTQELASLLGSHDDSELEIDAEIIKAYIEYLATDAFYSAPTNYSRKNCQWQFRKSSFYLYSPDEIRSLDTSQDNDEIQAWTMVDGFFYTFQVSVRDRDDYNLNNIYAYPNTSGPLCLDYEICRAQKLRTEKPTDAQVQAAVEKAQQMLDDMELGVWQIDEAYIFEYIDGNNTEYSIRVNAVPVFSGVPAIRTPQLTNLKSPAIYASNYYLSDVNIEFSAEGDVMDFALYSPVDVVQIINENVMTLSIDELMQRATDHLSLSDYYQYGFGAVVDSIQEEVECNVSICKVNYGLVRIKVANTDDRYYYVPAITLQGSVQYIGSKSGAVYYRSDVNSDSLITLLTINAVDGTIIENN